MGKIVVKLIGSGINAINAARNRSSSHGSTYDVSNTRDLTADQSGEFVVADDRVAGALINEGYAELPAPHENKAHDQYVELPASTSFIHEHYAELPAEDSTLHEKYAELPSAPLEALEVKEIEAYRSVESNGVKEYTETNPNWDAYSESNYSVDLDREIDQDEAVWTLDETAHPARLPTYEESEIPPALFSGANKTIEPQSRERQTHEDMIGDLLETAGPIPPMKRLPCPVVIPQRRPGSKFRGFVRAYAPDLADSGISQDMFLEFLEMFYEASRASKRLDVVGVATEIVNWVPRKADILTDLLVKTAAGTLSGVLATRHEKSFLDTVNQSIFMPRGLYAMVVEFKEEVSGRQEGPLSQLSQKIDRTLFAAEYVDITEPPMKPKAEVAPYSEHTRKNTSSQIELPESRPLIFPDLDCAAAGVTGRKIPNSNEKHEKLKKAGVWIGDQIEKRNSASNANTSSFLHHKHSKCFTSRYTNPAHPANNGKLISALTGGKLGTKPGLIERTATYIKESQDAKKMDRAEYPTESILEKRQMHQHKKDRSPMKKVLQPDVQYLVIVNMPDEKELQESVAQIEYIMKKKGLPIANGFVR